MQNICMDNMYNENNDFIKFDVLTHIWPGWCWAFIFHMTCSIFYIYLSITNNYLTQYDVLKSDSRVNGWKIHKKDKWLAITFSGTDAAGIRLLYMNTLQGVRPYYLNHFM